MRQDAPLPDKNIFQLGVPVLGICYGVQLFAHFLGGKVEKGQKREYGKGTLTVKDAGCALFAKLPKSLQVWNSHGDKLTKIPDGFKPVAVTENSEYAAIENRARKFFGLQFHPEVVHTPRGREIISNFVHQVCGCGKNWTMRSYVDQAVEEIRAQVGQEKVILGLSGGVDSSVAAALLHKAIGDQLTCIFVNNGLLRAKRSGSRAGSVRAAFQAQAAIREHGETVSRQAQGRDRSRTQTQDHRQDVHRSVSGGDEARGQGEISRAGHVVSRRDRVRADRRQSRRDDQEPSQRRRPAQEHEVSTGRAAEMFVQGRSAFARAGTGFAERNCLSPAVPRAGTRRADSRRSHAVALRDFAERRRHRRRGNEIERACITKSGRASRCCCRCAAWA